eukprot:scaffold2657_cov89-Amphora_coffeaeformis.AAC.12
MKANPAAAAAAPAALTVLVIAHPDDESMFFVPTIRALRIQQQQQQQHCLWLLCLTTGNYDGLGQVRSQELISTARNVLYFDKVLSCDDAKIQDHPRLAWDIEYVARLIEGTLQSALHQETQLKVSSIQIITFDELGVSGHINHRDTYLACRQLACNDNHKLPNLELWTLQTDKTPLFFKYTPGLAWVLLLLTWCGLWPQSSVSRYDDDDADDNDNTNTHRHITNRLQYPLLNWRAMASHKSQFVWYRRLFVVFSCYTYLNRIERQQYPTTAATTTKKNR